MPSNPPPALAPITPSDYVIIGSTGDLALRKIFPALFRRFIDHQLTTEFRLFAISRNPESKDSFANRLNPFCRDLIKTHGDKIWKDFLTLITPARFDATNGNGGDHLASLLKISPHTTRPQVIYLAISPTLFGSAARNLAHHQIVGPTTRLVVEKPLGHDAASSRQINEEIGAIFDESRIYRIDHYLGKETVQNLMVLRFANTIFESQWSNAAIDHVQITVAEQAGLAGRGAYYDAYGAMRDMVQNHLLQLVCLVAMEPPARFDANQIRDEKLRVLKALKPITGDKIRSNVILGQYDVGFADRGTKAPPLRIPSYIEELGAPSTTETFVALKLEIANWRWAGTPFYLRTGKRLKTQASEIAVTFRDRPHDIFGVKTPDSATTPNRLVIRLQPDEGLRLMLTSKYPGPGGVRLFPSALNLTFDDAFAVRAPDAYERLLMDVARGNQTLFMRHDEVAAAWDWIDPILAGMQQNKREPYAAGSMGPQAAQSLLERDNRCWLDPEADSQNNNNPVDAETK